MGDASEGQAAERIAHVSRRTIHGPCMPCQAMARAAIHWAMYHDHFALYTMAGMARPLARVPGTTGGSFLDLVPGTTGSMSLLPLGCEALLDIHGKDTDHSLSENM